MTTQNLAEADMADRLGIMRNGYVLIEGNPRDLVRTYKEKNLESLYTQMYLFRIRKNSLTEKKSIEENPLIKVQKLNMTGSEGFIVSTDDQIPEVPTVNTSEKVHFSCYYAKRLWKILPKFKRLKMLMYRDLLRSIRNLIWLLLLLNVPILLIILMSYTVGEIPCNLNVAVVNFEASEDDCKADPEEFISCEILALINKHVVRQMHYERYEDAEEQAFKLKVSAILIVGEKFTNQILRTMASIDLQSTDVGNPDTSQLILRLDMTSRIIANAIEGAVKTAVEEYLRRVTMGTKIQNATIGYPMKVSYITNIKTIIYI